MMKFLNHKTYGYDPRTEKLARYNGAQEYKVEVAEIKVAGVTRSQLVEITRDGKLLAYMSFLGGAQEGEITAFAAGDDLKACEDILGRYTLDGDAIICHGAEDDGMLFRCAQNEADYYIRG